MSPLTVRGKFTANLSTPSKATVQPVYVVADLTQGLLSRIASVALGLVARIETVSLTSVETVKQQFPTLFSGLGRMAGEYKIELKADAKPFALSTPRRVLLPLLPKVKRELARMEELGVISRVEQPTDWCAGMVPVPKPNRDEVHVCVDLTKLNNSVKRERHMLPSVEHTLGQLEGAKLFSKLDANSGFWQIPLSKQSALLTTFITPFGRFCFNRLCFGISSAPEHFQKRMSQLLEGLEGVVCQMDDILVYADTQTQHDKRLIAVLERLTKAGLTLKSEKCEFAKTSIKFLGQIIDTTGVKADPEKVKAVSNMEAPTDVGGVRRFLGMVNHLGKYLPHLAEKTQPLRELLSTKNMWCWSEAQQTAFDNIKAELSKPPNLALYNPKAQTTVSADASSYGLGAVLLQKQEDDATKPVAFASRALTPTEQRYAQIEKEALAITWACERFSDFLIGIEFHVETDHKPLVPLLGSKNLDELPPRVQRLRMRLMRYSFTISHVPDKHIATADVLSRAPEKTVCDETLRDEMNLYAHQVISGLPATEERLQQIREQQDKDETLKQIKLYCKNGWPDKLKIPGPCFPYHQHAGDLTVENELLLKELLWCKLERLSCTSSSLEALLFSPLPRKPSHFTQNPVVQSSLRVWSQLRSHFKYISASVHMPITQNHLFTPGLIDGTYVQWKHHGINTFKDLYKDGTFLTFLDLCSETNLPATNLFRYFQARHCTSALFPSYPLLPNVQPWEEFLSLKPNKKSIISLIYKQLMDLNLHSVAKIRGAWERELGVLFRISNGRKQYPMSVIVRPVPGYNLSSSRCCTGFTIQSLVCLRFTHK
uniref:ribonuclease H n=1 Tax=Astatotilapia calliptera TaxID=8154 RepID=A0A3P8NB56_ASTCA